MQASSGLNDRVASHLNKSAAVGCPGCEERPDERAAMIGYVIDRLPPGTEIWESPTGTPYPTIDERPAAPWRLTYPQPDSPSVSGRSGRLRRILDAITRLARRY